MTDKYPYEVTLFDTFVTRGPSRTLPVSPEKETDALLVTNNILIGGHVRREDDTFIDGTILNLTGLDVWCDATGFSGRHSILNPDQPASGKLTVTFQESSSPLYDLGKGRTLRLLSELAGRRYFENSKQVTLKEKNTIELLFPKALSIKQVMQEIQVWQDFLILGLRKPSYMDEIVLLSRAAKGFDRKALIVPGRKAPKPGNTKRSEILFNQSKLGDKIGERLKAWRQQHDRVDLAILIFSGAAYQDSAYFHTNLLSYLQALEVLPRELFKKDRFPDAKTRKETIAALRNAVPSTLDPALQSEIKAGLGYVGSVTLLDRIKELYSPYSKSVGPLFPNGDADMTMLKDVRNFLTHYGEKKTIGKEFLQSRNIFVLKEKTRLFLEICLLGVMEMTDEEIEQLARDFNPYNGWRAEAMMERINPMAAQQELVRKRAAQSSKGKPRPKTMASKRRKTKR